MPSGRLEDLTAFLRRKYCNRECMGKAFLSDDPTATYMRKFRKDSCENCGGTSRLGVHHKDEDRTNNSLGNLQTLCARCHTSHHWATGKQAWRRNGTCAACERPARKRGLCETHHSRWYRHGSPYLVMKRVGSTWQLVEDRG
jgi:hypothetical protein